MLLTAALPSPCPALPLPPRLASRPPPPPCLLGLTPVLATDGPALALTG